MHNDKEIFQTVKAIMVYREEGKLYNNPRGN